MPTLRPFTIKPAPDYCPVCKCPAKHHHEVGCATQDPEGQALVAAIMANNPI